MTMIRSKIARLAARPRCLAARRPACCATRGLAESGWGLLNMTQGVTDISRKIYGLHMLIFWVCVAIAVVVFGAMIWSIVKFRKSKGAVADTTLVHNTGRDHLDRDPGRDPGRHGGAGRADAGRDRGHDQHRADIKVTGFQWGWQYEYLDTGVSFFSRLDRKSDAARELRLGHRSEHRRSLPAQRRPSAGGPGRRQGAPADHRRGRHPLLVGAGLRRQEGRHPGLHQRGLVQGRRRQDRASTAASAPSCAAATTASCRSSSTCARRTISKPG